MQHIAFGLRWVSDVPLPDLPIADAESAADVCLWTKHWPAEIGEQDSVLWYASPESQQQIGSVRVFLLSQGELFLVRYGDGSDFLLHRSGSKVWCRWNPEFSFDYVATYLFGPILGFLLRLRGIVCLHASVVAIEHSAVAFMGPQGAGKSTLSAAFAERGFPVLSDDILAIAEHGEVFQALPAYPRIRLWPDSVGALFGSPEALPRITSSWDKRHLDVSEIFDMQQRALGAIYFLRERTDECPGERVETMPGATGLSSLIANTYSYKRFDVEMRAHEFQLLGRLAGRIPLRSAVPFADIARIGEFCDLIVRDFHALSRPLEALNV